MKYSLKPVRQQRMVVSLTTSPKRIKNIKPVIESMMRQTLSPDRIYINLPHVFKRDGSTFDDIPEFLKNNGRVYINRCDDVGPATKVLGCVNLEKDDTIILSIDDDIYYPDNLLEYYMEYFNKFEGCCITGTTFMYLQNKKEYLPLKRCEILEGFSGVLYRNSMLKDFDIKSMDKLPKECLLGDDFLLSNHLRKKGIEILALTRDDKVVQKIKPYWYGLKGDALHKGAEETSKGNRYNYKFASRYFEKKKDLYIHHYVKQPLVRMDDV
jgi:hypothetical protein